MNKYFSISDKKIFSIVFFFYVSKRTMLKNTQYEYNSKSFQIDSTYGLWML